MYGDKGDVGLFFLSQVGTKTDALFLSRKRAGIIRITFDQPQKAVARGQIAALWDLEEGWCLGSGTIIGTSDVDLDKYTSSFH
jgi:tRNA U34 2-thiouridine synthase MnmA/TrmU